MTAPWHPSEYLHVNGTPCRYVVTTAGCTVTLPDGRDVSLADLRRSKWDVREPVRWHRATVDVYEAARIEGERIVSKCLRESQAVKG